MTLRWYGEALLARAHEGAMQGVQAWIGIVEQRAVDLIQNPPKSGRIYIRRGVAHQASAPGEAPASDTGTLVSRRNIDLIPARLAARLTFTAGHAPHLEYGTRDMEPRSFARRALMETDAQGRAACAAEISAALR